MHARWTGSEWVVSEIGASGARLYSSEIWSNGALSFDPDTTDIITRSVQVGSAWEWQDWRTSDNGATWAKFADLTSGSAAGVKAMTPIKITGGNQRLARAVKIGPITNWDNFNMAINIAGRG
jgi:hypothetical protein